VVTGSVLRGFPGVVSRSEAGCRIHLPPTTGEATAAAKALTPNAIYDGGGDRQGERANAIYDGGGDRCAERANAIYDGGGHSRAKRAGVTYDGRVDCRAEHPGTVYDG